MPLGISAAAGKAGAIVGAFGFLYAAQPTNKQDLHKGYTHTGIGIKWSLLLLGATNARFFCSLMIPETNGKSLEELSRENEEEKGVELEHSQYARKTAPIE